MLKVHRCDYNYHILLLWSKTYAMHGITRLNLYSCMAMVSLSELDLVKLKLSFYGNGIDDCYYCNSMLLINLWKQPEQLLLIVGCYCNNL